MKKPFVTAEQLEDIAARYPTPFHLYDAQGIRENARRLKAAFSWNPGYREYFAVKATPTPAILKILQKEGCGCDCSSLTELMMAERIGSVGENIMFSSNETPAEDYRLAAKLGAIINLDDIHARGLFGKDDRLYPEDGSAAASIRAARSRSASRAEGFQVMDNPGDAKYGMTREQITQAFRMLKARGAEEFGIHAFLASNTLSNEYYPALAAHSLPARGGAAAGDRLPISRFINLSGGVGIPYRPEEPENDICRHRRGRAQGVRGDPRARPAWAMWPCAPSWAASCSRRYGHLVTRAIHAKHIYKEYIGVDACACQPDAPGHVRRPTTTSPSWARRTLPVTTSMTLSAPCARTTTNSPLTVCCRSIEHRRPAGHPRHRRSRPRHGL